MILEPAPITPLVWFVATVRGGTRLDPVGREGLVRHGFELARRGTQQLDRTRLDAAIDQLGAAIDVEIERDAATLSGVCLRRNLEATVALAADVLAAPALTLAEHERLVRDTGREIDEVRDDDVALVDRMFNHLAAPGHPYGRTTLGTEASLAALAVGDVRSFLATEVARDRLTLGLAGAVDAATAEATGRTLSERLPATSPPLVDPLVPPPRPGRRLYVIDKPERSQCQMLIGHGAPAYGSDDFTALLPVDAAFGGTFTSRLMQEIRVKHGWSYNASCRMMRARLGHWFRIHLAPSLEVAPAALVRVLELYQALADDGLTADELAIAKGYLVGSMPFHLATARQRMRIRVQHQVFGLPPEFTTELRPRLEALSLADVRAASDRWLRPGDLAIVIVASADQLVPRLEAAGLAVDQVLDYRSY